MSVDPVASMSMYQDRMDAPEPEQEQDDFRVADGRYVTVKLDRSETGGAIDVIEILADPGVDAPQPHRHAYGEWFRVLEGELTICEAVDGTIVPTTTLCAGDTVWIAPHTWHGTLNLFDEETRYEVITVPGTMTGALRQAGVKLGPRPEEITTEMPDPEQLKRTAARWGIEFWDGPTDLPVGR